jgi:hypothetical protein
MSRGPQGWRVYRWAHVARRSLISRGLGTQSRSIFPLRQIILCDDSLASQRPLQSVQRFPPESPIRALRNVDRVWRDLTLAPNSHDFGVYEVDPTPPIKGVKALYYIVWFAWTRCPAVVSCIPCVVAARDERRHGPESRLPGVPGRFRPAL